MKFFTILLFFSALNSTIVSSYPNYKNSITHKETYNIKTLYSSDFKNKYFCYEYQKGYEIIDSSTNNVIEFSPTSISPYLNYDTQDCLIYNGPMSYGSQKISFSIKSKVKKEKKLSKTYAQVNHMINNSLANYDTEIENSEILSNLDDFKRDNGKEYNHLGTCGYLSAAMILYYSKYKFNNNFISNEFIEYKDGKRRFKAELHDKLYNIGLNLGKKNSTTAFDIKDVMNEYCKEINIKADHYAMLLSTIVNIHMCIQDNKPIALFGNFVSPETGKKVNHVVTCYGTRDIPLGQGKTNRYFIVNFGWTNYSRVYLLDNIFRNPVGSMYNMNY